jgi:nucleotide-binding universal stress UspA family protein
MLRTLVVPLDGSALAERALPYALALAKAREGRLILMRAGMAPAPRTLDGAELESDQAQAMAEAETYLLTMAEKLRDQVASVDCVVQYGRPAGQILETAARHEADVIVMATHGRTGLAHLLYGSVTEAVLAETTLPVFVVYAQPSAASPAAFAPANARVLVPQDESDYDAPAVRAALELVGPNGEITLASVIAPPEKVQRDEMGHVLAYLDQQEEADRIHVRDYLDKVAATIPIGVKTDIRIGDPTSCICAAAIESRVDAIVMATHGRTGLRRAVLGSVAGDVLRMATTPVLLVHPRTPARTPAEKVAAGV